MEAILHHLECIKPCRYINGHDECPLFFFKEKKRDQNAPNRHLGSKETLQMMVDQLTVPPTGFFSPDICLASTEVSYHPMTEVKCDEVVRWTHRGIGGIFFVFVLVLEEGLRVEFAWEFFKVVTTNKKPGVLGSWFF